MFKSLKAPTGLVVVFCWGASVTLGLGVFVFSSLAVSGVEDVVVFSVTPDSALSFFFPHQSMRHLNS